MPAVSELIKLVKNRPGIDEFKQAFEESSGLKDMIKGVDSKGWTALMWAIHSGQYEVAKFLLENGADLRKIEVGRNQFHPFIAAINGDRKDERLKLFELLLEQPSIKIDFSKRYAYVNKSGAAIFPYEDIFHRAVRYDCPEILRLLIE